MIEIWESYILLHVCQRIEVPFRDNTNPVRGLGPQITGADTNSKLNDIVGRVPERMCVRA